MSETKAKNKKNNICHDTPFTDIYLWALQVTFPRIVKQYSVGVAYALIYFLGSISYSFFNSWHYFNH